MNDEYLIRFTADYRASGAGWRSLPMGQAIRSDAQLLQADAAAFTTLGFLMMLYFGALASDALSPQQCARVIPRVRRRANQTPRAQVRARRGRGGDGLIFGRGGEVQPEISRTRVSLGGFGHICSFWLLAYWVRFRCYLRLCPERMLITGYLMYGGDWTKENRQQ